MRLFMLEDFIGSGHSAVGNLVILALGLIAKNPRIAAHIQKEIDRITTNSRRTIDILDVQELPYTITSLYEVLRYALMNCFESKIGTFELKLNENIGHFIPFGVGNRTCLSQHP